MGLAAEPWGIWPLGWLALAPLWIAVLRSRCQGVKDRYFSLGSGAWDSGVLRSAIAWGIGYYGLALSWIKGIHPMTWLGIPWLASLLIALFCWGFITAWGVGLVTAWGWLFSQMLPRFNRFHPGQKDLDQSEDSASLLRLGLRFGVRLSWLRVLLRVLLGTALWCVLEWLWSSTPLWWASLSYTQSSGNLVILHLGQLSGPGTVTAALVMVNGLIAEAWIDQEQSFRFNQLLNQFKLDSNSNPRQNLSLFLLPLGVFLIAHLTGFALYNQPLNSTSLQALKVGIIQGNIPNEIKLGSAGWQQALEGYTAGYKTLADQGVDAVLTPETALPFLWIKQNRRYSSFDQAILEKGVLAWVGSFGAQDQRLTNSLFTVADDGTIVSQYNKVNLVPLGEYIPFEQTLGRLINRLSPLKTDLARGQPDQIFPTPLGQAIVGICYDSAFARHFRRQAKQGGEFILTASNNAHYSEAMLAQHHAQDVMRAIETNRWAIRATNTGYSAIVNPHGQTLWKSQAHTYTLHADTIYRRQIQTPYVKWGDWLSPLWMIILIIFIMVSL
ncbi:MAG: apolipoprotein N-acyltransferase [Oscillatoriales cyanobacterium RM2_1_1]|nr:apolipoprotein N-acyltransferase [Oscillatoriales cyanobacterium SM2_3_0]NJO46776.1 apolipoprotein N-acyltransferase [Oscillatoriales cyanobacterium RM2_1_1]